MASATGGCFLRGWRRGRRRIPNRRLAPRAPQDPVPGPERRARGIQDVGAESAGEDVEGRGLEGAHGRQWNQLHTHCALLGCAVQRIQRLQEGK